MKREQPAECGGCGAPERFLLHNVRHRASYRRLCTNCVLKNHQGLFCSLCLEVFNESPPPHQRLICLKCPSISHLSCSSSSYSSHSSSFTCPTCSNPNFSFFNVAPVYSNKKPKSTPDHHQGSADDHHDKKKRVVDRDAAKALLAAAKIAATSMSKAAAVARVEAERRVKEATLAKKRAKEALERLAFLARKDNDRLKPSVAGLPKSKNAAAGTAAADADRKTNALSLPSPLPEKGNSNGLYSVSAANAPISVPKLQRQHSAHGMPN